MGNVYSSNTRQRIKKGGIGRYFLFFCLASLCFLSQVTFRAARPLPLPSQSSSSSPRIPPPRRRRPPAPIPIPPVNILPPILLDLLPKPALPAEAPVEGGVPRQAQRLHQVRAPQVEEVNGPALPPRADGAPDAVQVLHDVGRELHLDHLPSRAGPWEVGEGWISVERVCV